MKTEKIIKKLDIDINFLYVKNELLKSDFSILKKRFDSLEKRLKEIVK